MFVRFRRDLFPLVFVSSLGRFELHAEHVFVFFDAAGAGVDFVLVVWMCKGCFVRVSVLRVGVDGRVLFVGFGVDVGFGDSVAVRERVVVVRVVRDEQIRVGWVFQ